MNDDISIPNIEFRHSEVSEEDIEILEIDELYARRERLKHDINKAHRIHFYLMIYIEEGEGEPFIDFESYAFQQGSFIFINKHQVHAFSLDPKIKGKIVLFTEEYLEKIQTNINISSFSSYYINVFHNPVFTPKATLTQRCMSLILEIKKETEHPEKNSLMTMLLFSSLFLMLERERPSNHSNKLNHLQTKQFQDFIALLSRQVITERNASYYATQLGISYKTLNTLCKLVCHKTAKQLIDEYVIVEAKRHLILEERQIHEIAYDFGFMEVSNFVKYFKKHTSRTPAQFKKETQG